MERSPSTASVGSRQHSRSSTRLSLHGGSRQQSAPRVRKYKEEVVNEIVKGAPTHPYRPNTSGLGDDFDGWSPAAKIAARRKKSELDFEQSRVAIQRQVEQTIKVEAKKRDRQFHKHHDALRAEETGYMQEIDAFLDYRKQSASEKKQEVFQRWDKEVFKKIQEEVNEKLGGVSTAKVNASKRAHYQAYLDRSRTQYRDIVIKSVYDPFPERNKTWSRSFSVQNLEEHDPCHSILTKANREVYVGELNDGTLDESNIANTMPDRFNGFPAEQWNRPEGTMYREIKVKTLHKSASASGNINIQHYTPGPTNGASKEWVGAYGKGMRHQNEIARATTAAQDKSRLSPHITYQDGGADRQTRTGRWNVIPVKTGPNIFSSLQNQGVSDPFDGCTEVGNGKFPTSSMTKSSPIMLPSEMTKKDRSDRQFNQ